MPSAVSTAAIGLVCTQTSQVCIHNSKHTTHHQQRPQQRPGVLHVASYLQAGRTTPPSSWKHLPATATCHPQALPMSTSTAAAGCHRLNCEHLQLLLVLPRCDGCYCCCCSQ